MFHQNVFKQRVEGLKGLTQLAQERPAVSPQEWDRGPATEWLSRIRPDQPGGVKRACALLSYVSGE